MVDTRNQAWAERCRDVTVKMGWMTFDDAVYDAVGDVLYLSVGKPTPAADSDVTPEGHVFRYAHGRVIGLTIINARWLLERDGSITVTEPEPQLRAELSDLREVLGLAS
jgi:uncharacterized protein YuzE